MTGGDWEKQGVVCVHYGVRGERVPSTEFGGSGYGRVAPNT